MMERAWDCALYSKSLLSTFWYLVELFLDFIPVIYIYNYYTCCRFKNTFNWFTFSLIVFHIPFVLKFWEVTLRKVFREPVDKHVACNTLLYYFPIVAYFHRGYISGQMYDKNGHRHEMNKLLSQRIERGCCMSKNIITENFLAWERGFEEWVRLTKHIRKRRALEPTTACLLESIIKTILVISYNIFSWTFTAKKDEDLISSSILPLEDKHEGFTDCDGWMEDYLGVDPEKDKDLLLRRKMIDL